MLNAQGIASFSGGEIRGFGVVTCRKGKGWEKWQRKVTEL